MAPRAKPIDLEFAKHMFKHLSNGHVAARYRMKKPSDIPSRYQSASELPMVQLEVKRTGNDFLFNIMLKIHHRNILRLEAIKEETPGGDKLLVFVEPHGGPLIAYLEDLVADSTTGVIPSQTFRDLVRQIVDGLEELRVNRLYHGAVSIENIYYVIQDHVPMIKLANFRELPGTALETAQLHDWVNLGHVLTYISNAARRVNNNFSCALIDRLALKLLGLADTALLPVIKKETLAELFFWDTRKRTNFYIHDIEEVLEDPTFIQRVNAYPHWRLPWNSNPHDGLISAMDDHRRLVLRKAPYAKANPMENIKCMCGAYTHQDELKGKIIDSRGALLSVDAAVQKNQQDLFLTLYRLKTGEIAAEEEAAAAAAAAEEEAAAAAAAAEEEAAAAAAAAVDAGMGEVN